MKARILAKTKGLGHAEWLRIRKLGIGGSDIAAIAGLSNFGNKLSVYAKKTGAIEDDEENEAMLWGTLLEGVVADEFARREKLKIRRVNAILQHPEHDFMLANLDRLVICQERGEGVLEIKTANQFVSEKWADDAVPMDYQCQVQWYMGITGLSYAYIAALIGGQRYVCQPIARDEDVIAYLQQLAIEFWDMVQTRTIPAIDGSDTTTAILTGMFKDSRKEPTIELPESALVFVEKYHQASTEVKAAEERKVEAANNIRFLLGEHEVGACRGLKLSWTASTSKRLDGDALRLAHPEIHSEFLRESTTRRLNVPKIK